MKALTGNIQNQLYNMQVWFVCRLNSQSRGFFEDVRTILRADQKYLSVDRMA